MKCPRCQYENPDNTRFCGQCGREMPGAGESALPPTLTYQTPTRGLDRGTTFAGRFEIIEEIGQGGMGTVYKAYDTKIREMVALKLLRPEIASDFEIIDRFHNELKLARKVSHRHVCRMYDLNEEGKSFYISMEYVPGEDLKSFIRRSGHLNEAKVLDLARQITEGLAEAHRLGVIHRDLKPQNIMIDREGNAKIMDFGIARSLHARGMTATGLIIGTPEYMSPEQAEGRQVDHRTDIYSLGVILYEMATGRVPFEGETPLSIALKHKGEPPADPRELNAQVSQGFSQVILKCLEKAREDRYGKAEDLLADLGRLAKGMPAAGAATTRRKPITTREITVKFNLKKLLIPGLIAAVLLIAALAVFKSRPARSEMLKKEMQAFLHPPGPPDGKLPVAADFGGQAPSAGGKETPKSFDTSKILTLLGPIIREANITFDGKNPKDLNELVSVLKEKIPASSPFSGILNNIQSQIQQGEKLSASGNTEASRKSYTKGESEMRKLLTLVSDKEKADRAKIEMDVSKRKAEEASRKNGLNLLAWIAAEKEKDAADSYQKNDFAGARILFGILNRVYLLSLTGGNEEDCLAALGHLMSASRAAADSAQAPVKEGWLYSRARESEAGAAQLEHDKAYSEAAERYILAAFLYEKARDVAIESAQTGPQK